MKPRLIALVDLDDSLFQTLRKCPPDVATHDLSVMAVDRQGNPLSFATPRQKNWIDWLQESTVMVPVTARSFDALSRVNLTFEYAVAAHGGIILRGGMLPCQGWHDRMTAAAAFSKTDLDRLAHLLHEAAQACGEDINVRIISEGSLPLYLVAKHVDPAHEAALHALAHDFRSDVPSDWTFHINGNNVAFLPPSLGKHHAVAALLPELRSVYPDLPVLGLGDSLTDAPFLALCDFIAMPGRSQLAGHALHGLLPT